AGSGAGARSVPRGRRRQRRRRHGFTDVEQRAHGSHRRADAISGRARLARARRRQRDAAALETLITITRPTVTNQMATAIKQENESRPAPVAVEDAPKGGKKKFVLPIVGILVLIALFWAFKTWSYGRAHESTDNAAVDGHLVPVLAKASGYVQSVTIADNDQ